MKVFRYPLSPTLLLALGLLTAAGGCASKNSPQDVCDCLNQSADAYLAKHPDLTKDQLEESGDAIMTDILAPCKAQSDAAEKQLAAQDLEAQTKTKELVQTCLNALGEKMKQAAKPDAVGQATEDAADRAADDAEAAADKAAADLEAGTASADAGTDTEATPGSVSDEAWDRMIDDYTDYVNQYAALMRKGAKGDMSAMGDAAAVQVKSQELEAQLKEYGNKATAAQQTRFAKAQARALQTMMGAQK